jgi:hypothetical protein
VGRRRRLSSPSSPSPSRRHRREPISAASPPQTVSRVSWGCRRSVRRHGGSTSSRRRTRSLCRLEPFRWRRRHRRRRRRYRYHGGAPASASPSLSRNKVGRRRLPLSRIKCHLYPCTVPLSQLKVSWDPLYKLDNQLQPGEHTDSIAAFSLLENLSLGCNLSVYIRALGQWVGQGLGLGLRIRGGL